MKPNEHIAPFLAQPVNLKVGLNHLGYRNAPEDLFITLLPGLNNVTARIRYYSFYCWLLEQFFTKNEAPTPPDYNRFIRYSEYLLAILHTGLDDAGGIPGIDYALNVMKDEPDVVDLAAGAYKANGNTRGSYWANAGGVLRQYYGNSLHDIGITVPSLKLPGISDISKEGAHITGKDMADIFEESIGEEASTLFLECVKKGKVSKAEREKLWKPFLMKNAIGNVHERSFLIDMLLQEDLPGRSERYYRKETIRLFLEYYREDSGHNYKDELGFPKYLYDRYLNGERDDECIIGWYCYYLDDVWQYNASVILERILDILSKDKMGKWVKLDEFTTEIATEVASMFNASSKRLIDVLENFELVTGKSNIEKICGALSQIMRYHVVNANEWPEGERLKKLFGYHSNDDFRSISSFIESHKAMEFTDFVKYLLESRIIYRHYNVSLRKFYQTGIASHKFMLEDGYIRYLTDAVAAATHTSPRLNTLKGFLSDLDLIKEDKLTDLGRQTLTQIN